MEPTRLLSKLVPVRQMQEAHGAENSLLRDVSLSRQREAKKSMCTLVHETSSTGATTQLATGVEFFASSCRSEQTSRKCEFPKKSSEAYRIISEVSDLIGEAPSAIRFWEQQFRQLKPLIINNRRYYSAADIEMLRTIKDLLQNQGYTIAGAVKCMKAQVRATKLPGQIGEQVEPQLISGRVEVDQIGTSVAVAATTAVAVGSAHVPASASVQLQRKLRELLDKAKEVRVVLSIDGTE